MPSPYYYASRFDVPIKENTMKAPDKIYLSVDKNEDWKYAMWTTKSPQEQKFSELDKHEEYIRKDALLEWAKEKFDSLSETLGVDTKRRIILQELIDKLNSI